MMAQDQWIGTRLEKCVVERLIGRGGYGLTFLAFDGELQEHRVIKVSQDQGLDEASRRRHLKTFLDEGLILSRLKHHQIVTLRGQGDKDGRRYMILDYIQGFSLRTALDIVVQRQTELGCAWRDLLDPLTATALILSALYPLEYAHRANVHLPDREIFGVAHRDISPGNLILGVKGNEKGRLVLIDFGTAKTSLTENVTVDQNLVGTIPYMGKARLQKANSPEQKAQYQEFWKDFRETQHDIHAIGVLYYQLLTGNLPFHGETLPQIIAKILDPEAYSRCHLEIASAHAFASGVFRKCLVYHDFSMPLSEQPYQYPDAGSMRPEMEDVFHSLSGGRTVDDVLVGLAKKLANPELMQAAAPDPDGILTGNPGSVSAQTGSWAVDFPQGLPYPPKRRPIPIYAAFLAGGLALILGAVWRLDPFRSHPGTATLGGAPGRSDTAPGGPGPVQRSQSESREILERLDAPGTPVRTRARQAQAGPTQGGPTTEGRPKEARVSDSAGSESLPGGEIGMGDAADPAVLAGLGVEVRPGNADAARTGDDPSVGEGDWGKEGFVRVQTLVREEDPTAYEKIGALLVIRPDCPDLRLLKSQLILMRNPLAPEARRDLVSLQSARAEFMHPDIFHEQALYLLWKTDAASYEAQKNPGNRVNVLKSANAYLSEFGSNPAYRQKAQAIRERLPR